jgi:hypothetical protein
MRTRSHRSGLRDRAAEFSGWRVLALTSCLAVVACAALGATADLASLCADRAAVERVYYNHRLGEKPAFEKAMPATLLERLVQEDLRKESVLKRVYGVEITPAQVDAEVQRINSSTRAPEVLAELKAALGNDPVRFARTIARPIIVEQELRQRFENDDKIHLLLRQQMEQLRARVLAETSKAESRKQKAKPPAPNSEAGGDSGDLIAALKSAGIGQFTETTWELAARPASGQPPEAELLPVQKRSGPNALVPSGPHPPGGGKAYFGQLPEPLQNVLRAQLRQPGDVSAVIEMPAGFALYVAEEKTVAVLKVATVSLPKRSYQAWLNEQSQATP